MRDSYILHFDGLLICLSEKGNCVCISGNITLVSFEGWRNEEISLYAKKSFPPNWTIGYVLQIFLVSSFSIFHESIILQLRHICQHLNLPISISLSGTAADPSCCPWASPMLYNPAFITCHSAARQPIKTHIGFPWSWTHNTTGIMGKQEETERHWLNEIFIYMYIYIYIL